MRTAKSKTTTKKTKNTTTKKNTTEVPKRRGRPPKNPVIIEEKKEDFEIEPLEVSKSKSKKYAIVVFPEGNASIESIPDWVNPFTYAAILSSFNEVNDVGVLNIRADVSITDCDGYQVISSTYDSPKKRNLVAEKFKVINKTKNVGGNLVILNKKGDALTSKEAQECSNWVSKIINSEEPIDIEEKDDRKDNK